MQPTLRWFDRTLDPIVLPAPSRQLAIGSDPAGAQQFDASTMDTLVLNDPLLPTDYPLLDELMREVDGVTRAGGHAMLIEVGGDLRKAIDRFKAGHVAQLLPPHLSALQALLQVSTSGSVTLTVLDDSSHSPCIYSKACSVGRYEIRESTTLRSGGPTDNQFRFRLEIAPAAPAAPAGNSNSSSSSSSRRCGSCDWKFVAGFALLLVCAGGLGVLLQFLFGPRGSDQRGPFGIYVLLAVLAILLGASMVVWIVIRLRWHLRVSFSSRGTLARARGQGGALSWNL